MNEVLYVHYTDNDWWQAMNQTGEVGIVPAAYVCRGVM
jgi:hypothetical protein